ncbi:MAG: F0F1 ATP synthase subunit delta [Patescibacteria group bacterium]
MKRDKSKEYAEAFLSAMRGKNEGEQKYIVRSFLEIVVRRGERKIMPRVLREVALRIEKERGEKEVHIEVARAEDRKRHAKRIQESLALLGVKDAPENISVHRSIIGGFRIRHGGTLYDASHRKHLLDLYRRFIV